MSSLCLLFLVLGLAGVKSVDDRWRNNCTALRNSNIAPFLYQSQSDLAVLAFYSNVDYNRFKNGREVEIFITPTCYVKGFTNSPYLTIVSGTQRCAITPLSPLIEFPSLFFLRKQHNSNKWILLNSGEYQHVVINKGILYGFDTPGDNLPQTCGVTRRRTPHDENGRCKSEQCKAYCSYKVATPSTCVKSSEILAKYLPKSRIPTPVSPYDTSVRNNPQANKGSDGQGVVGKYSGGKSNSTSPSVEIKKSIGNDGGNGGGAASLSRPLFSLVSCLLALSFLSLR